MTTCHGTPALVDLSLLLRAEHRDWMSAEALSFAYSHGVSVCCYAHRWNASFAFRTCSAGFSVELLALSPLSRRLSWTSFRYGRHLIACLFCGGRCAEKATTLPQVSLFKVRLTFSPFLSLSK